MKKKIEKKKPKYLTENKFGVFEKTFEKAMASIARSFSKMDQRFDQIDQKFNQHDRAFTLILKQMQTFTEEAREHRQTMSSLIRTDISQEKDIDDLKIRVERLETQMK